MPVNHFITLDEAIQMTTAYRASKDAIVKEEYSESNLLAVCETFDRSAFDTLLSQEGCVSLRIYFGMNDDLKIHAIVVGVNESDEDQLPGAGSFKIVEQAIRCPSNCP